MSAADPARAELDRRILAWMGERGSRRRRGALRGARPRALRPPVRPLRALRAILRGSGLHTRERRFLARDPGGPERRLQGDGAALLSTRARASRLPHQWHLDPAAGRASPGHLGALRSLPAPQLRASPAARSRRTLAAHADVDPRPLAAGGARLLALPHVRCGSRRRGDPESGFLVRGGELQTGRLLDRLRAGGGERCRRAALRHGASPWFICWRPWRARSSGSRCRRLEGDGDGGVQGARPGAAAGRCSTGACIAPSASLPKESSTSTA